MLKVSKNLLSVYAVLKCVWKLAQVFCSVVLACYLRVATSNCPVAATILYAMRMMDGPGGGSHHVIVNATLSLIWVKRISMDVCGFNWFFMRSRFLSSSASVMLP
jgi:hypothetical protein